MYQILVYKTEMTLSSFRTLMQIEEAHLFMGASCYFCI